MFVRTIFMSLMVTGVFGAMKCNGNSPLRDAYGMEMSCQQGMPMMPPQTLPNDSLTYMSMAAAGDLYEIQSSQIALAKGGLNVRNLAQMLINDHTQTTATLKAAAASAGLIPPPPVLNPMQVQMISQLQLASNAAFDQIFLQQQLVAHKMALDLHNNYALNGDVPALRSAAASAVPIVQMHLNKVMAMPMANSGSCPTNFWCNNDVDNMGMSFAVCCPSNVFTSMPSMSIASPYFSASLSSAPIYNAPLYNPFYSAPIYNAPVYNPFYTPIYSSVGF